MTLIEALADPRLLGGLPAFRDLATWTPWLAFLKAVYGLPLSPAELITFQHHTHRQSPRPAGYPEACLIVGVQSGKSRIAAAIAVHAALFGKNNTYALMLAQGQRSAMRVLLRYAREPFETLPAFQAEVHSSKSDTVSLKNGVTLAAYPCNPASIRGLMACVCVIDELAFFTATDGRPTDKEMLIAARGRVANTGGRVIILSSPYGQSGALWDLHRRHYGQDSTTLVWQATAPEMNPTLSPDYLARMETDDPEAYRSEVLGEFRAGLSSLLDPDALDACVSVHRDFPRAPGTSYVAHYDPSGGRGDAAALAIGHRGSELIFVDLVRRWPAPHDPDAVIVEAAAILTSYGVSRVQLDRYGGDFPTAAFRRRDITADTAPHTTSENYIAMVPTVNTAGVRLPNLPELLRELRGLERRRGTAGRDHADHRRGSHDDMAAATAGLIALLAAAEGQELRIRRVAGWG